MINRKALAIAAFIFLGLAAIVLWQKFVFNDGKLHVVFCDVGQGDAIFIRTPKGNNILVDGGPDRKVLHCLSRHMPFWDHTLALAVLTHPHADHFNGLIDVATLYKTQTFVTEDLKNKTLGYTVLQDLLAKKHLPIHFVLAGSKIKTKDGLLIEIVGPSKAFLQQTSPNGEISESAEFASLIAYVSYGDFHMLLDGDSQLEELKEGIEKLSAELVVLQVPHHGSKTGIDKEIIERLRPKLAVISVGKNNRYGHPAPATIAVLQQQQVKTLRTDQDGEIEIISDGKSFQISR